MDKVILESLPVQVIIGTLPEERTHRQALILHAELFGDFRKVGVSDDLMDSFDYSRIEERLATLAETSYYKLLEALAEHLCSTILAEEPKVESIRLRIDKPGAPRLARCISVEIERSRKDR